MRIITVAIACLAIACATETKRDAYEEAARRLNPILLVLQPTKARLQQFEPFGNRDTFFDENPAAIEGTIATCPVARDLFRELGKIDFWEGGQMFFLRRYSLADEARSLADCFWNTAAEHARYVFWWHYRDVWNYLTRKVEGLRYCAAQEGVEIVSLGGTRNLEDRCP